MLIAERRFLRLTLQAILRTTVFISTTSSALAWSFSAESATPNRQHGADEAPLFDLSLEELLQIKVVTAVSGYEQPVTETPASVNVITRQEWVAAGAQELNDVLQTLVGVHISKVTTGVTFNKPVVRGISGDFGQRILILIDGKPFRYNQNSGRFIGSTLLLDSFKRIEVVRSPGSAIYGADAIGGVINLVSDDDLPNQVHLTRGNFNTLGGGLSFQKTFSDGSLRASLSHQGTDGDTSRIIERDLQSSFDQAFGTQVSLAPGSVNDSYNVTQANTQFDWKKLSLQAHFWHNNNAGTGAGVAAALDPTGWVAQRNDHYTLRYQLLNNPKHDLSISYDYTYQAIETFFTIFPAGTRLPIGEEGNIDFATPAGIVTFTDGYIGAPRNQSSNHSLRLTDTWLLGNKHKIRWEIGHEEMRFEASERKNFGPGVIDGSHPNVDGTLTEVGGTPYVYLPKSKREITYFSAEDHWSITDTLNITMGARYDRYSDFGRSFNPRAGIMWQYNQDIQLSWYGGSAFRSPAIVELYAQNNPSGVGNQSLKPETASTYEQGISGRFRYNNRHLFSASAFNYELSNLIGFVSQPDSGLQIAQNFGEQKGWGVELENNWEVNPSIRIKAHYTYLNSKDNNNQVTADIPSQMAYVQMLWQLSPQWQVFISDKWIGPRKRQQGDGRQDLEGYHMASMNIAWAQNRYRIALKGNNVFDSNAREPTRPTLPNDYPLNGRQWLLSFSYRY